MNTYSVCDTFVIDVLIGELKYHEFVFWVECLTMLRQIRERYELLAWPLRSLSTCLDQNNGVDTGHCVVQC